VVLSLLIVTEIQIDRFVPPKPAGEQDSQQSAIRVCPLVVLFRERAKGAGTVPASGSRSTVFGTRRPLFPDCFFVIRMRPSCDRTPMTAFDRPTRSGILDLWS